MAPSHKKPDVMWDDSPVDVTTEANFIWSIANKLRGTYQSDKYKDVIIPMTIIRRFECALAPTKEAVLAKHKEKPDWPVKAMYRVSGYPFYNTSGFDLARLVNDPDHLAAISRPISRAFRPIYRTSSAALISLARSTRWTRTTACSAWSRPFRSWTSTRAPSTT